ncbi:hypothetical protein [Aliterella atlantica]|uniref:Uncharacterized protein n=1 Tax=Aliterella atlantica CENA595 TaxID=1618023 RepID=A0A0D8ZWP8_9CYAN|nr:hypothetical protein [Aliterella atlantica]KJH72869.1 hypothetical protein UH38_04800 [Aliterella atlantica CENA595]
MSQEEQPSPPSENQPNHPAKQSQSAIKTQSIKVLRGTIRLLEGAVSKLEAEPVAGESSLFDGVQQGWRGLLATIRSFLPENLSTKLSDLGLTGIIATLLTVVVWISANLLSNKLPVVANLPTEPEPTPTIVTPIEPTIAPEEPTDAIAPVEEPESTPTLEEPAPEPTIPTPPELSAPAEPEPIAVTPQSEPVIELTPEQSLIASVQAQIAQVSDRFADGLIQSVQANFEGGSLSIQLKDDWYTLKQAEQDKLANRMFNEAEQLDFTRLELTDAQGTLLARSPVVGKNMIIFKRQQVASQLS